MTWISTELADYQESRNFNDNVMSDDVSKINSILKIIDKTQYYTIKQKAIQTYMEDDDYDGIVNLVYYKENDIFPFHNQKIQLLYEKFCEDSRQFYSNFYNLYTSDGNGRSTWRPVGEPYVSEEIYKAVMEKIAALDARASKLAESMGGAC